MTRVVYEGPGHFLLAHGREFQRGEPEEVSEEIAEWLLTDPHLQVTVLPEEGSEPEAASGEGQTTRRKRGGK